MDFNKLLQLASNKTQKQKSASSGYSTKLSAAKKEEKQKKGVLSKGVQAFLERQKKEQQEKEAESKKRTQELRQTRKDLNTQKRANAMASRTKDNLKVFKKEESEHGEEVPPPDDFDRPIELSTEKRRCSNQRGFLRPPPPKSVRVPQTSPGKTLPSPAALMAAERAERGPVESKQSDIPSETKSEHSSKSSSKHKSSHSHSSDSSSKHKSESSSKHKHDKSSHKSESSHKSSHSSNSSEHKSSSSSSHSASSSDSKKPDGNSKLKPKIKPRPRPAGPPPMSFEALLSMAQEKHKMPVDMKKKTEIKKKAGNDRPMTQEEKEVAMLKQSAEYRAWYKKGGERPKIFKRDDDEYSDDSEEDEPPAKVSRSSYDTPPTVPGRSPGFNGRSQDMDGRGERKPSGAATKQPQNNISSSRINGGHRSDRRDSERSKQQSAGRSDSERARLSSGTTKSEISSRTESRSNDRMNNNGKPMKRPLSNSQDQEAIPKKIPSLGGPGISKSKDQSSKNSLSKSSVSSGVSGRPSSTSMRPEVKASERRISSGSYKSNAEPEEHVLQCGPAKKKPNVGRDSRNEEKMKEILRNERRKEEILRNERRKEDLRMEKREEDLRNERRKEDLRNEKRKEDLRKERQKEDLRREKRKEDIRNEKRKEDLRNEKTKEDIRQEEKRLQAKKKSEPQMSTWDRIYGQIQKNNPKSVKRRPNVISDSEEEYYEEDDEFIDDDEDGDFIDDSDQPGDISSFIRDIFGYDRKKYRDEDDDLRGMEASYSTIAREEARSAKLGLKEDLEDIRKEQEEKKQKMLKKKQMAKAKKGKNR